MQEKYSEILEEIPTGKNMENSTEPPHLPVQQRLLEAQPRYFTCKECSQSFSRTDRLISHEKQAHNIHRLYCSHCSKSFLSKSLIERHMRTHTGSKPFRCTVCSKSFSQKVSVLFLSRFLSLYIFLIILYFHIPIYFTGIIESPFHSASLRKEI